MMDEEEERTARPWPLREILATRQARLLIIIRSMTDAAWYLFLFWMILYFRTERHFTVRMVAELGWIPFLTSDIGALFGGWMSSALIRRGFSIERARKTCMLVFAFLLPACLVGYLMPPTASIIALALCSVATFGHMAWGTNELTLHSDLFPTNCLATIMGITGAAGAIGGIIAQQSVGFLVDKTGTYLPVFVVAACLHPIAGLIVFRRLGSVMQLHRSPATIEPPELVPR
jgi:ACS family hexuronate transporter-like MFS transporter